MKLRAAVQVLGLSALASLASAQMADQRADEFVDDDDELFAPEPEPAPAPKSCPIWTDCWKLQISGAWHKPPIPWDASAKHICVSICSGYDACSFLDAPFDTILLAAV